MHVQKNRRISFRWCGLPIPIHEAAVRAGQGVRYETPRKAPAGDSSRCVNRIVVFGVAAAQLVYDVANYKALADAGSTDTIPPGRKITLDNWQKYKKFMPVWMQAAYSGQYKWHVGEQSEYTVEVGATQPYPMVKYVENTEK